MGQCAYCGKPAGFFRSEHPECKAANDAEIAERIQAQSERGQQATELKRDLIAAVQNPTVPLLDIESMLHDAVGRGVIESGDGNRCLALAFESAIVRFLDDGLLSDDEEKRLHAFLERFPEVVRLADKGAVDRIAKAGILKALVRGDPLGIDTPPTLPINLQRGEKLVWFGDDVHYLEDKVRREFVGRSKGVSVRMISGVYVRMGAFKGKPVESTERVEVAVGTLFATTKHLYFTSPGHSMRIPYAKIVAFEQFTDGLGLVRDAARAKPQIFVNGDGWFLYNLVTNLAQRD